MKQPISQELIARISKVKSKMRHWDTWCYAYIFALTLSLSVAALALFIIGIIFGGNIGPQMAQWAGQIMEISLRLAVLGVFLGLVHVYLTGNHSLRIEDSSIVESPSAKRGEKLATRLTQGSKNKES